MTKVVLATRNAHKVEEVQEILAAAGAAIELLPLPDEAPDVVEHGLTFAENALLKARSGARFTGRPAIADDSGICVDVLNGMPGIFSAHWAGRTRDDNANLALLLDQIADIDDAHRGAAFVCAAALVLPDRTERVVEGRVEGTIAHEPRGTGGFGYDPIFRPAGSAGSMAELPAAEKHAISHRGRAFRALVPVLHELVAGA